MSALVEQLEDYLRLRRALGFKLELYRQRLLDFIAYLEASGASTVTVELALAWARRSAGIKPITASYYLSTVRGFARYLYAIDPGNEVPPPGLLAVPRRRPAPYLYSLDELARVLELTRQLRPPLRAATHTTLLGLLAATGMRIGEALALTGGDVDLAEGVLTVRHAKFDRMRLVPLHASVTAALREYAATRDRLCPTPRTGQFFVSRTGRALRAEEVDDVFRAITVRIGLCTATARPRVHDLRHSFAVHTLIGWQRDGADVAALLPVLSTYLGHVEPANTYWYLSATPELMQLAANRLEGRFGGRP